MADNARPLKLFQLAFDPLGVDFPSLHHFLLGNLEIRTVCSSIPCVYLVRSRRSAHQLAELLAVHTTGLFTVVEVAEGKLSGRVPASASHWFGRCPRPRREGDDGRDRGELPLADLLEDIAKAQVAGILEALTPAGSTH